ncbi:MAG: DeoR/GlpR transcriptional regulator [Clostridia bacterium]|nr:DeoR/GlpR transcriptional regulator [Clostridia bacterium]
MHLPNRQTDILNLLKQTRSASVKTLAEKLFVSEMTIRRDLKEMHALGLIERTHGAVFLPETTEEVSMFLRMAKNAKAKEKIATKALPLLPEFSTLFIDGSSTALALVQRMNLDFKTVVTYNLQAALQLSKNEKAKLILLGGNVEPNSVSTTGSWTVRQIKELHFDLMICSTAAVIGEDIYERSLEPKEIKYAALCQSKKKILLVDKSKFQENGTYRVGCLKEFDMVITD